MKKLTSEQKSIIIDKGTERPFTGKYLHNHEKGNYTCAQCGSIVFSSDKKYDSNTGWPSFNEAVHGSIEIKDHDSGGTRKSEVVCAKCGGHLGHVFDDGPKPSCKRYCINSASIDFKKK